jgi:hypothetical protein
MAAGVGPGPRVKSCEKGSSCLGCNCRVTAPPCAMKQKWKPGDLVTVTTVNRGLPVWTKRHDTAESWAGEIVGPSLVGPGWWNVRRRASKARGRGGVYAVPDGEIRPRNHPDRRG